MNSSLLTRREQIEQDFQNYCHILLYKWEDYYSIPEWNVYYEWGAKIFTLEEIHQILVSYRSLENIFPKLNLMPNHKGINKSIA